MWTYVILRNGSVYTCDDFDCVIGYNLAVSTCIEMKEKFPLDTWDFAVYDEQKHGTMRGLMDY